MNDNVMIWKRFPHYCRAFMFLSHPKLLNNCGIVSDLRRSDDISDKGVHNTSLNYIYSGPLFTKRTDVLPQDLVKSRSRGIQVYTLQIASKVYRHLGISSAEMPVKFQSDTIFMISRRLTSYWIKPDDFSFSTGQITRFIVYGTQYGFYTMA